MKKVLLSLLLLTSTYALPAQAEVIDLATVKCSDLATMSEEDGSFLFIWLHGYFAGESGDTTMDLSSMEGAGKAIGDYCAANPDVGVLAAAKQAE